MADNANTAAIAGAIRVFDNETNKLVDDFIAGIDNAKSIYSLTDKKAAEVAKARIGGQAKAWLDNATHEDSTDVIKKHDEWEPAGTDGLKRALQYYFGKKKNYSETTRTLYAISQKKGESAALWRVRVDGAVREVMAVSVTAAADLKDAKVKGIAQSLVRMFFHQGLRPAVKAVVDLRQPKTLDETFQAAEAFELTPEGQRELNTFQSNAGGGREVGAMSAGKSELICFYCGIKGHAKADCFKRKADVAKGLNYDRHPDYPLTSAKDKKKNKKSSKKGKRVEAVEGESQNDSDPPQQQQQHQQQQQQPPRMQQQQQQQMQGSQRMPEQQFPGQNVGAVGFGPPPNLSQIADMMAAGMAPPGNPYNFFHQGNL